MKTQHDYRLSYSFEADAGHFTKEQLKASGRGGTDAWLFASILYPADGSLSVQFASRDGRSESGKDDLDDTEWFKVWSMLTSRLAQSETLSAAKRDFCQAVFMSIRDAVLSASGR